MLTNLFVSTVPFCGSNSSCWRRCGLKIRHLGVQAIVMWVLIGTVQAQGTWTRLTTDNPAGGSGTPTLLTDGTVIVQGPWVTNTWTKLTPDSSGNYLNGAWSSVASMGLERLYTGNIVLPNGKVFVLGGEYSGPAGSANWTNTGEIYDPIANTWAPTKPFPRSRFGDGQAVLLPNGKILAGYLSGPETYLYNPANDTWSQTGTKLRSDRNNEETWLLLPGGDVLCYEIFSSPDVGPGFAQRYVTSTGLWVDAGSVPVPLSNASLGYELGPGAVLPDGRVIQTGGNNNTAIYTPSTNTWVAGPSLPPGFGADDSPGAMLPNGQFIFAVDRVVPDIFTPPTRLYSFDYRTNLLTDVTPSGPLGSQLASDSAYVCRMLVLPNGHMLFHQGGSSASVWDYAPVGAPLASWKPTITSVVRTGLTLNYTITGTRLTGISEGANYGDDAGLATNYPIVRLTKSNGEVTYARSSNWTPSISLAGDSSPMTAQFTLPAGFRNGDYQLAVIANGIASANTFFRVGPPLVPSNVNANYNLATKTLTLAGDANSNTVTVTYKNGKIAVEGSNGTKINNLSTFTPVAHSGKLTLAAVMGAGDDSVSIIGVDSSTTDLNLGSGKDMVAITLCKIQTLKVDGGVGIDSLVTTSSTITTKNLINIP